MPLQIANAIRRVPGHKSDEFADSPVRRAPYFFVTALLVGIHVASSWLGYVLLSGGGPGVTPVFPEAGLDLVAVLVAGRQYWPVLLSAYVASALWRHVAWAPAIGIGLASLFRTLAAAWLFRRIVRWKNFLGEFVDLAGVMAASTIAPGLASAWGTLCLVLGGTFPAAQWEAVYSRWWIADGLGTLTLAPVLLTAMRAWTNRRNWPNPLRVLKFSLYLGGAVLICYGIFLRPEASSLLFGVFLLILVAAAWLGPAAAQIAALVVASTTIWATHAGVGAFAGATYRENIQNLVLFLAAVSLTGMALGAFRSASNLAVPGTILLAGWALSGWLYASLERSRVDYEEARLDKVITTIETRIQSRFRTYEDILSGASGLVATVGRISPKDWDTYVDRLHVFERYPGTVSLSLVERVADSELRNFVEAHRRGEWPGFTIHQMRGPAGGAASPAPADGTEHFLVMCVEPAGVAAAAMGTDLTSDPHQRRAAEQARDSGGAVLTQNTELGSGSGRGLQLFAPVYRLGAPVQTTEERRRALLAWVTVVFSADPFFESALAQPEGTISLRVSGSLGTPPGARFFSSATARQDLPPERTTHMSLAGSIWTLEWTRLPGFPFLSRTPSAWAAGCTALLSLLLAGLAMTLEATMRRAADRLRVIQSATTLGTWELDMGAGSIQCSQQLLRLYGSDRRGERLTLAEWGAFVHPDDRDSVLAQITNPGGRETIDRQYRVVWPDGSLHWLHSKALVVGNGLGKPSRVVGIDFDISEIKQLQSRLAEAQKLESVGQLASGIAHEINTPIQYIGDNAKFLEDAFQDLIRFAESPPSAPSAQGANAGTSSRENSDRSLLDYLRGEIPKAISQLLEGVEQVARIVRAMKEFSHPGQLEVAPVDLNRAIASTILVSKNEWKYVSEVTTDLAPDLPPVPCVPGEVNQVILNLIVNAAHAIGEVVKETGRKGHIHISTRHVDSVAEIRISDTGGGIPEGIQSKVFDPFFTTKPVGKGTGQGLAIAHSVIAKKYKGTLTFETEPGIGTTFIIQLPLVCELEAA